MENVDGAEHESAVETIFPELFSMIDCTVILAAVKNHLWFQIHVQRPQKTLIFKLYYKKKKIYFKKCKYYIEK